MLLLSILLLGSVSYLAGSQYAEVTAASLLLLPIVMLVWRHCSLAMLPRVERAYNRSRDRKAAATRGA